jgi:hypothetical protein
MVEEFFIPRHRTKAVLGESTCSASVATGELNRSAETVVLL